MKSLEKQLSEYSEYLEELHPEITPEEIVWSPVRVSTPTSPSRGMWRAGAAAAIVILVIGAIGLLANLQASDKATTEPTTITTVFEGTDALPVAMSFAQARSGGDVDAVLALLADDAVVSMGPAASKGDVAMEMRWQEATGLTFVFDRCVAVEESFDEGAAAFSCFVSWTGAVANSLGYGADTFEYSIKVADGKISSAVLLDLGEYSMTTWRPFRDWIQQNHDSEIAVMYTPEWHAALTDQSIELWKLRTAEFVAEQDAPSTTTTEEPDIVGFTEQGELEVNWVKYTGRDGTQPYGIGSYDAGVYTTVTEDGRYTSEDAMTWMYEPATSDTFFPNDVSDDGQWGMANDFFTGTLLRNVDGEWQVAPRPPQADQSGDWVWMRHLASSGDVLLVIGGPPIPGSSPPYPLIEAAAYWRIDSSGQWRESALEWDGSFYVGSVPAGGFAYTKDGSIHTSVDGITWIDRGTTRFPFWEDGVFPGLLHATIERAGESRVWTSPDAVTWTYEFTTPYDEGLDLTNHGFVATRLSQGDADNGPGASHAESWLLNDDRKTWTALTAFDFPGCEDCGIAMGAAGDVVYVSISTSGSSALMYLAIIPSD